jgi:hypothetical protein
MIVDLLPNPDFVASNMNVAPDADDIAATVLLSIGTAYTESLEAIDEGNAMLASL